MEMKTRMWKEVGKKKRTEHEKVVGLTASTPFQFHNQRRQAQAMSSFQNVRCVFEVECWVKAGYTV